MAVWSTLGRRPAGSLTAAAVLARAVLATDAEVVAAADVLAPAAGAVANAALIAVLTVSTLTAARRLPRGVFLTGVRIDLELWLIQ
jgi:hypothetical protein